MEIKRKKITREEIFQREQTFASEISDICQSRDSDFRAIGYELELEFGQKANEQQSRFDAFSRDESKKFDPGYVSRAMITVKRQKTEEEKQELLRLEAENRALMENAGDAEESEQLLIDETLRDAEFENKRSVAFTVVMLVRAYKSFWTEWISLADGLDQLQADLDEFFEVLSKKQEEIN